MLQNIYTLFALSLCRKQTTFILMFGIQIQQSRILVLAQLLLIFERFCAKLDA